MGRLPGGDQRGVLAEAHRVAVAGLPSDCGNWKTVYNRHRRWSADGTWADALLGLQRGRDGGESEWTVAADSTVIRAHQHAAGARQDVLPRDVPTAPAATGCGTELHDFAV